MEKFQVHRPLSYKRDEIWIKQNVLTDEAAALEIYFLIFITIEELANQWIYVWRSRELFLRYYFLNQAKFPFALPVDAHDAHERQVSF